MKSLADFAVTRQWPARYPDRLQLYSLPTPNGTKVSIMLEETGLAYEAHRIDFESNEQSSPAFLSINPNGKIPAILDPNGPGGQPIPVFESGAILLYLAEKTGQLMPHEAAARCETIQWLMFQMAHIGPMFGQVGFFHRFAGRKWEDKRPLERYVAESRRLLQIVDERLARQRWILGADYSIADIATFPLVNNLITHYQAADLVNFESFSGVQRGLEEFVARPAVQRGLKIPARGGAIHVP